MHSPHTRFVQCSVQHYPFSLPYDFKNDLQDNINVVENGLNTGKNVGLNVSNLLTCNRNSNIGIHQVTCVFVVM